MAAATTSVNGYLTSTDWTTFNNKGSGTVTSVSGTAGRITSTGGTTPVIDLVSGIATSGTTGSVSLIPVVTIDTYGRVTSITTAANPQGTVTSVSGTGTVNGITLTGTVTTTGSLTLGGTLSGVSLTTQVSGTLPTANGGTGITTTPSNGQIPIGNGTNYVAATLTAGTGIGITNASGAVTVAVNTGPAFSASQSANQSIANATYTKIQFNTEDFDTNGNYDNATNYRFTPTVGGYYQINAQTRDATGAITGVLFCAIYKNGAIYKQSIGPVATAGLSTNTSAIINFNGSSDYVEVYAYQNSGSAMLIGSGTTTYFNGCLVRGT
jgi:hypothetical protein